MTCQQIAIGASVLILIVSSLVMAVRGRSPRPPTVPPGAKPGDLFLEPCSFKSESRKYQADCGILAVPENRNKLDSRLIAVPVKRIRSASLTPAEPIFYLAGGPGASNMRFKPPEALLAHHDVVIVGYRGVDGSVVLDCPEYGQAMLGIGGDVTGDESLALMAEAARLGSQRLEAEGVDLAGYTIVEVAEDLETARS